MRLQAVGEALLQQWMGAAETFVRANPVRTAAILSAIVLLILAGWALFRWLRRPMGKRFTRVLTQFDEIAILMHPNPDPDAMACAMGVACLASQVGTTATLQYAGQIRHQENRAFRTVLDLDVEQIGHVDDLAADDVVLVDHNTPRGFDGAGGVEPVAVVDHHPGSGEGKEFTDQRTEYGACASIIAEYFMDVGARHHVQTGVDEGSIDGFVMPSSVATGLLYGIESDTKHLTSGCSQADFDAGSYLYPSIDEDALDRIANPQVSAEVLEVKARAIAGREIRGSFAIADVGELSDADAIPQAADELMHLEGVTAVVVAGERDGTLHLSGRSRDDRVHMGRALQSVVDDIPMAEAGGHARMGGGQIPVDHMAGIGPGVTSVSRVELTDRLFDALNGNV